jgi:glycosyltransferase involved in cell wall biosynthesis
MNKKRKKILQIHAFYKYKGGEDYVVLQQKALFEKEGILVKTFYRYLDHNLISWQFVLGFVDFLFPIFTFFKLAYFKVVDNVSIVFIHNNFYLFSPFLLLFLNFLNFKVVLTIHNYRLFEEDLLSLNSSFSIKKASRFITKKIFFLLNLERFISCFVVPSPHFFPLFKNDLSIEKVLVIPPVVWDRKKNNKRKKKNSSREKFIFYAGRISKEKGIVELVQAMNHIPEPLIVSGNGPLLKCFLKMKSSGKFKNVFFTGNLNHNQLRHLLRKAALTVVPSIWNEPFGQIVVQAMEENSTLLLSEKNAFREITKNYDAAFYTNPENIHDLVAKICKIVKNNLLEGLENSNEINYKYTKEYYIRKHLNLITKISKEK